MLTKWDKLSLAVAVAAAIVLCGMAAVIAAVAA